MIVPVHSLWNTAKEIADASFQDSRSLDKYSRADQMLVTIKKI